METSMIEKLDAARSSFLKWATVGYAIWFGTYIVADPFFLPEVPSIIQWIRILGWLILAVSGLRAMKLKRELRWDKKMRGRFGRRVAPTQPSQIISNGFLCGYGRYGCIPYGFPVLYHTCPVGDKSNPLFGWLVCPDFKNVL